MEQDLRNAQSDEAVSASLEPKTRLVNNFLKKDSDIVLDAIESVKNILNRNPFHVVTEGNILFVYYRDYEHPAWNEEMLCDCVLFGEKYAQSFMRHYIKKQPQQTFTTPVEGC